MTRPRSRCAPVAGMLLIGDREEPFLDACLESIAPGIDLLVVNDNSSTCTANRQAVERSALARTGRVRIVQSPFLGFGPCRMQCLDALRSLADAQWWVLKVDADEVHHDGLPVLTRRVLPELPARVRFVDGFFLQLCVSPRYYLSIDRRHNLLVRFHPELRYEGRVHEQLVAPPGRRLAVPYRYFHYGYVAPREHVRTRWRQYGELGDQASARQADTLEETIAADARRVRPYRGRHPRTAAMAIDQHLTRHAAYVARFENEARTASFRAGSGPPPSRDRRAWYEATVRWTCRTWWSRALRAPARDLARCDALLDAAADAARAAG